MQLTYIATLALLSAYAALASCQEMNVSLPLAYEAKILRASEISGQCPSSDQRNTTFTEIKEEIGKIIQDYVIPIIQDAPIEPTVSPSNSTAPCCGEENTGWTQAVFLNMTDTSYNCPGSLVQYETPKRSCGRGSSTKGCFSTSFSVNSQSYSKVCGRIIGYQVGPTTAFRQSTNDIDSRYISGVSLTYGSSPRKHIWSFAAALGHSYGATWNCPCTSIAYTSPPSGPSFVEGSYFCETGTNSFEMDTFYPDNPLWDGKGCKDTSTCCELNNPPWFCQDLSESTTEAIEMRLCSNWHSTDLEDTPIELIELYIK